MNITVILCTYNRCRSLERVLAGVAASTLPEGIEWEALIVDNNSADRTREVAEDFCRRYPGRFRYLFEARQGKSYALNSGVREARGDVLVFVDDDVSVPPQWLANLTASFSQAEWAGAGGRILPEWTSSPPRWLPLGFPYALAPLAAFDPGPESGQLTEPPFGTNMAFRKAIFEKYGGFRTDLGPRPDSMIRNEDTEFGGRLLAAGERLCYEPLAVVLHPVTAERARKAYFLQWWFAKGRADILQHGMEPGLICWRGIPLVAFRRVVMWTLRWMVQFKPGPRFQCRLNVWYTTGRIAECYRKSSVPHENSRTAMVAND